MARQYNTSNKKLASLITFSGTHSSNNSFNWDALSRAR
jgi:hypothetical protein